MADVKTEQEPSIEEILESIRQIISDDTDGAAKPAPVAQTAPPPATPAQQSSGPDLSVVPTAAAPEDVLDLVEKVESAPSAAPQQPQPQHVQPAPQPVVATKTMDDVPMTDESASALMSVQTAEAATEALSKLMAGNVAVEKEDVSRPGKVTLEEMTRELMKPMLKTWIDQNLPGIIEKAVQKEIEKLSRRAMDR